MKKQKEHTFVLVLALLMEVGLIVLFALKARREALEGYDWKHLAAAGLGLFFLYIMYVEVRIKRAGRTLVEEKIKTHTLVESLPQAVVLLNADLQIINANAVACRLLGIDPLDAIGKDFPGVLDAETAGRLRGGAAGRLEATAGGRKLRLSVAPLRGEAGSLAVLEEPEPAPAPALPQDGGALLAGMWEALSKAGGDPAALIRARKSLNLLEDPARLGKPAKAKADVAELVRGAVDRSAAIAKAKGLKVEVEVKGDAAAAADRDQLLRAIDEIVFNACSYTKQGFVKIAVDGGSREVTVQVTDSGIGIPAEEFGRVFDMGFVGSNQLPETQGGRGAGLALAKRVVESHGGSIMIESRVGQGTRITLNIPRA